MVYSRLRRDGYYANTVVYHNSYGYNVHRRRDGNLETGSDPTEILQEALDEGGKVYVLDGTYPLTDSLEIPSGTHLVSESWNTIYTLDDGVLLKNENFGDLGADTDIVIEGGYFKCLNPTLGNSGNITIDGAERIRILNVKSTDSRSECIKVRNAKSSVIMGCHVERSASASGGEGNKAGIMCSASEPFPSGDSCSMIGNIAIDTGGEGLGAYYVQRINIEGNISRVTGTTYRGGILIEGDSSDPTTYTEYVNIVGNNVMSNAYCISGQTMRNFSIAHNNCTHYDAINGGNGIQLQGFQQDGVISDNTLRDICNHGISITAINRRVTVHDNIITNAGASASNTYDGIYCAPGGGAMRDCHFHHNTINDVRDLDSLTNLMRYGVSWNTGNGQTIINCTMDNNDIIGYVTDRFNLSLSSSGSTLLCQIKNNRGYRPGTIASPFNTTNDKIGMHNFAGSTYSANPVATRSYTAVLSDLLITSSGGTAVAIDLKDESASTYATGLTTLTSVILPVNHLINFGNFSVAPTVTVAGI